MGPELRRCLTDVRVHKDRRFADKRTGTRLVVAGKRAILLPGQLALRNMISRRVLRLRTPAVHADNGLFGRHRTGLRIAVRYLCDFNEMPHCGAAEQLEHKT
jgi:hypothetical protein